MEQHKLTTEVTLFTPQMASNLLKTKNLGNRPDINATKVDGYARDMKAGNWKLNGEAIIFDTVGNLMNGQHRLMACVAAKVPFETVVIHGVDRDTFDTLDTGWNRSVAQILRMGHTISSDRLQTATAAAEVAAVTRMIERYERFGRNAAYLRTGTPTRSEQLAVYNTNKLAIDEAVLQGQRTAKMMSVATGAFLFFVFLRQDAEKALKFWQDLAVGQDLAEDSPALALRKKLYDNKATRTRFNQSDVIAYTFLAWNAYKAGRGVKQLTRRADQSYPSIDDAPADSDQQAA